MSDCLYPNTCGIGADCSECHQATIQRLRADLAAAQAKARPDIDPALVEQGCILLADIEAGGERLLHDMGEYGEFDVGAWLRDLIEALEQRTQASHREAGRG